VADPQTVIELLKQADSHSPAIAAPERPDLSFGGLVDLISASVNALNSFGLGRNDPVVIVLPNGPEMATAFLAVAAATTSAPLNPNYRAEEFEFYLTDLEAKAVVVMSGDDTPVRAVAQKLKIPLIELVPTTDGPAGLFELQSGLTGAPDAGGFAEPNDTALVLHTSGTTSRPKIVPLAQSNICASARHIRESLQLTPADRCLNVMPLFHIHGLIAGVLSSLGAGGSTYCTPGFNAMRFFGWMDEAKPSWYTSVPTMHQLILTRAGRNEEIIARNKLRFIRSSSSSLAPSVMAELESVFEAPVIESYGMTEAAHQMTSNPLPESPRKPGTVGIAAGPQVAIMDEAGAIQPQGTTGEIVILGPNVTTAYQNNPEANATAFSDGWFRTGDQGLFDEQGYLTITGRLKEIINRGGEKISPREIDEVLLTHPAVAQAVTFATPHERLGEEIAAAVVLKEGLKEGEQVSERDIRKFVGEHVADYKTPRQIVILDEIPKGATGKIQRIGLAEKLGLT
jgi:acyl-CoA synthetase (AMP-forming)/AMP-acid ligase II